MVNELYASIQGESTYSGRPCVFVRLTGCPLRCSWCDSAYAFQGGERMALEEILARVSELGLRLVEVTGGEPLVQPGCLELLTRLCDTGYEVLLETGGALDVSGVDARVVKIVDVKCPGSGEAAANRWANMDLLGPRDELKFVLAGREDYDWACGVLEEYGLEGAVRPIHFSPVHGRLEPAELARWILEDRLTVRLHLQWHKRIWPGLDRGI
jgi:7-carboxy-7-deazaguanine synthase